MSNDDKFMTDDELDAIIQRREIDGVEAIEHLTEAQTRLALAELRTLRAICRDIGSMVRGYSDEEINHG